ncbi:MAG: DUF669 domain-containing protein [Sphaerochaeta sp.]|jgi:hypothetical protein|nr:DUF669 domain-containing protein [Sphaerochaeta sp.]
MDINDHLAQYKEVFDGAEVKEESNYEDLPDGTYQMRIEELRFEESKKTSRPQLCWTLVVVAPSGHINRKHWHYRGIADDKGIGWMKQELANAGMDVLDMSITDIPAHLEDLLDNIIEVQIKTKGEYRNSYINRVVSAPGDVPRDELPVIDDDGIAF